MIRNSMRRFINGFCCSVTITLLIQVLVMAATGELPMLPEYMLRFRNPVSAFAVQLVLVGVMSGITSAGTAIFEAKRIGLIIQSILFLLIMLSAWIPVACFAWGFHKYVKSMVSTIVSIIGTYGICWGIQYRLCRRDIEAINEILFNQREG